MTNANGAVPSYVLNRDELASTRLTLQHFAMIKWQSWMLHPDIQHALSNTPNPKIADLASGNGIWGIELAEQLPSAEILCTDISDEQFPAPLARPSNTKFEVADLFEPPPQNYVGYYDVVHLRLTVGWLLDRDWRVLLRNVLSMLKPGGWIQWEEVTAAPSKNGTSGPMWLIDSDWTMTRGCLPHMEKTMKSTGMWTAIEWVHTLPEVFKQYGLQDVATFEPKPRSSVLQPQKELLRWFLIEIAETMVKNGRAEAKEQLASDLEEFDNFYKSGKAVTYGWCVALGRKPL